MATGDFVQPIPIPIDNVESDYGSDFDDDTWEQAFSQTQSFATVTAPNIEEPVLPQDDLEPRPSSIRLARIRENLEKAITGLTGTAAALESNVPPSCSQQFEVDYTTNKRGSFAAVHPEQSELRSQRQSTPAIEPSVPAEVDTRSPIERFRSRKPLSVTDIVTPAWCELQYWYSLTKYGRVRRTAAMKAGSKIHKEKEREVYTEVHVEIATKEEQFGLRLWNIIQGLRTLRATGLTRELEVLGLVEGEVIVGIIDQVSFNWPDEELEQQILENETKGGKGKGKEQMPADQRTLTDFFAGSQDNNTAPGNQMPWSSSARPQTIYLVDIKTRKSKEMPKLGGQMRATQMQLMMYRRLLHDLAANKVEASRIFSRYDVDANRPFSDTFMAQLANLDLSSASLEADDSNDEPTITDDSLEEILSHNTLQSLWSHMIAEFARTIHINPITSSISPLLTAEFRSSSNGELIGQRNFAYDSKGLDAYVQSVMRWWRGEREPVGVEIEEVYKCKSCHFLDSCTWRKAKAEELREKAKAKNAKVKIGSQMKS